jgi:hypothetical protein
MLRFAQVRPRIDPSIAAVAQCNPGCCLRMSGMPMGTVLDHRRCAEECVAMARLCDDDNDKALWLTLAQSWVRLAEHVARARTRYSADETALEPEPDPAI